MSCLAVPNAEGLPHGVCPVNGFLVLLVWSEDAVVVVNHQLQGQGAGVKGEGGGGGKRGDEEYKYMYIIIHTAGALILHIHVFNER